MRSGLVVLLMVVVLSSAATGALGQITGRSPRVLILYPYDERLATTTVAGEAARSRLIEATNGRIDVFSEFLDLSRFPEPAHKERMARYLAEKYAHRRPDVILVLGESATDFIVDHRGAFGEDAKIIVAGFSRATAAKMNLPDYVIGAYSEFDIVKTLDMARRLQPGAKQLFVIAGSSEFDRYWLTTARRDLGEASAGLETSYLGDLTIAEFAERASRFPRDSIVLVLTIFVDRDGRNFVPREALREIAKVSSAPVYGPYATYVGYGVVGGHVVTFSSVGAQMADLALEAIDGKAISDVDVVQTYIADAKELKRWGLSEKDLPENTIIEFRQKSLWEEYWPAILGALFVIALQATVIAVLLVERRRRKAAQQEARRRLLEVVHLNQAATAGALSASIAHELNQPLGAIRNNAEAAEIILSREAPDLELVRQIVNDIREDDERAGDIIQRMRGLLKRRGEVEWQEFDLNDAARSALRMIGPEAARRRIAVRSSLFTNALPVLADKVHVQQVILNVATNAMDAMVDDLATERKLTFATGISGDSWAELTIADTGVGIAPDKLSTIFDPFVTTKPTGIGLGLSIARTIVETYGGRISAGNRPEGGAAFRVVLPLSQGA